RLQRGHLLRRTMKRAAFTFVLLATACGALHRPGDVSTSPKYCDGLTANECANVRALALTDSLPPSPGNAFADDERAALLGFQIFFGRGFSNGADVRCATCHQPELTFRDSVPVSKGIGSLTRNAPTIYNAARMSVFFWDGRADSLWSQPLFAIENP